MPIQNTVILKEESGFDVGIEMEYEEIKEYDVNISISPLFFPYPDIEKFVD